MERNSFKINIFLFVLLQATFPWVCRAAEGAAAAPATPAAPFIVYTDDGFAGNKFQPTEYIGDREALQIDAGWKEGAPEGQTCLKVTYAAIGNYGWAGLYWVNPAGNWGNQRGGYDLRFAKKLTFWARGEKGGEHIAVFRYGGIKGNFSDSDNHGIGPLVLTKEWKQYTVDLSNRNLKYISAGFSFALTKAHNRQGCIFYLDAIQYE